MRKNKYSSDYRGYMNKNVKEDDEQLNLLSYSACAIDTSPISLDVWDRKSRVNSAVSFRNLITKPSNHKQVTLLEFATELKLPVQLLLQQFDNAGISNLTPEIIISERHKTVLLEYLRKEHGTLHSKITLTRPEIRKKRILLGKNELLPPIMADTLYQDESPSSDTIVFLEDINDELLFYLAKKPEIIYELGSRKFEELIAKLLTDKGHEVSLTKNTRDGGYDIFAKVKNDFSEFIILAECKKYSPANKVGVEIVRGLYGVVEEHKANQGIIITSSFFTKEAQQTQLRIGNRMALKDYNDLVEWLGPYSK